jgi:DNA-binding NarL/FixJ family response regulator
VLVVDDHVVFRMGLRQLLGSSESIDVVSEASSGEEALEKARETHPDVVIMDVRMPNISGIEATRRIKEEMPDVGVVMMSALDSDTEVFDAIEAGASGYVLKDEEPDTVLDAIKSASEGRAYLPPSIAKRVMQRVAETLSSRSPRHSTPEGGMLTDREATILRLLAEGKRNREIAALLGISERTVGNHIVNIYNKLHIKDRASAVIYAVQKGLIKI